MNDVYGHEQAKKVLQVLINRSQERYFKRCVEGRTDYPDKLNCLLAGRSGTGKTFLVKSICEKYNVPLLSIDATQLMPTGNDSGINSKQLQKMIIVTAQEYLEKPEFHSLEGVLNQMVIFVDEFDKLGISFDSSGNWNKHVQANFLTLVENKDKFSGISWIFAGAFSDAFAKKTHTSNPIGFFPDHTQSSSKTELSEKDILKAGIIPEMLGRISLIVELDDFTLQDYENMTIQILKEKYSKLRNINITEVAKTALASGQGVRSIIRQLEMTQVYNEYNQSWRLS